MPKTLKMIDVSSNNHGTDTSINWKLVHDQGGIEAVMIKATQGVDYVNPWAGEDAVKAIEAGIRYVGYYHFCEPCGLNNATDQANYVVEKTKGLPRNLGIACDLEVYYDSWDFLEKWRNEFLSRLEALDVANRPWYTNGNFLDNIPGAVAKPLWFADPGGTRLSRNVWAWQYSWIGAIPGINGYVDLNTLYLP